MARYFSYGLPLTPIMPALASPETTFSARQLAGVRDREGIARRLGFIQRPVGEEIPGDAGLGAQGEEIGP